MSTLRENLVDFESGVVTEAGFNALHDAESYDQVSSISSCAKSLGIIRESLAKGDTLVLYVPNKTNLVSKVDSDFKTWCETFFPASYEYLIKYKK